MPNRHVAIYPDERESNGGLTDVEGVFLQEKKKAKELRGCHSGLQSRVKRQRVWKST
jgi:hypothetical protein